MANLPYDVKLLDKMYQKIKNIILNNNMPIMIIMNIPNWNSYYLENIINNEKLFIKKIKRIDIF